MLYTKVVVVGAGGKEKKDWGVVGERGEFFCICLKF